MNKILIMLAMAMLCFTGCAREIIEPGKVGICVNLYGNNKGVNDYPIKTGVVWYNPMTTSVYEYPTFTQNATWQGVEKISFNTNQGSKISADVALSYMLAEDKVPHIFVKHRRDLEYITHNYLRNKVRDAINKHSSEYTAIEALGTKTQQLILKAREDLVEELADEGFVIDTLSFISAPEPDDPSVKAAISQVINSTQKATEAENKVKQIEAEAKQEIARAEGKGRSIEIEAQAQAKANKIVAESLTPELVRYKMIEKWNGIAPQVVSGDAQTMLMVNPNGK
jgi:regulator of protease activity HflC (stomatin/prohibitin superfamily)